METLPLLPGYKFSSFDSVMKDNKLKQKFKFKNGFPMLFDGFCLEDFSDNITSYNLSNIYNKNSGKEKFERFLPQYVIFANKCLSFDAYFQQGIFGSQEDYVRPRLVKIIYYLENDTMGVFEPSTNNSRYKQGRIVKRGKILKKNGEYFHWQDLNVATNIEIYGTVYRIVNCDLFTKEFLMSQGIDVGEVENLPEDNYLENRDYKNNLISLPKTSNHSVIGDKRLKFLEYDSMVLSFDAIWNGDLFKVLYFLVDDTISIIEVRKPNDGKEMGKTFLKKTRVPKNWKDLPSTYPAISMEINDSDVREFYSPHDLRVGETIFIYGRKLFLYDCDLFTRKYYQEMYKITQPEKISIETEKCNYNCNQNKELSHYEKKHELIRKLYNHSKKLRYLLKMDSVHSEDENREFVMEYHLADGMIRMFEKNKSNSGRRGGCYLNWNLVPKPNVKEKCYYTPEDFLIGAKLNIFENYFIITGADPFVYKYIQGNHQKFNQEIQDNMKEYFLNQGLIDKN